MTGILFRKVGKYVVGTSHGYLRVWVTLSEGFGEALQNLQTSFPDNNQVKCAVRIFSGLTTGGIDLNYHTRPSEYLDDFPEIGEGYYWKGNYRSLLSKDQWDRAMGAFNHRGRLPLDDEKLFRQSMLPILQAGITGLTYVFTYQHYRARPGTIQKLPPFPELQGHAYIYLTSCEPGPDNDD
jgi:hypothetical protein